MDWKSLIFPFVLLSYVNCYDPWKSSLVFVIDDTGSMSSIINQVKSYAKSILNTVVSTKASQIENFVLVTFNDYDHLRTNQKNAIKRIVTTEPELFEQALNEISVDGGWDCPEYSLSGIKLALEESLPRSYVYVFTDAAAKDYTKYEEVKNLALKKSTQISFIISGTLCKPYGIDPEQYLVYNNLADATSGQVFTPMGTDITNILIFVEEVMKGRMGELAKQDFPPGRNHAVLYPKEKFTGDVFVMIMGILLDIDITDPDGKRPHTTDIVRTDNNRVIKVESDKNGIFIVTLSCSTDTKVVVEGRTTMDFQHGFKPEHSKNKDTTVNPLPDVKSNLYIYVNIIQGGDIKLTKVQLLDSSGNVLQSYPLKPYDNKGRVYVTDPFKPPKQTFRVMVVGLDVDNNSPVIRLAPTATEPESVRPQIIVVKTQYTVSEGDTVLSIPCHALGYPTPTITWVVDGKPVLSGSKHSVINGTLLVRSPDESDTRDYTCIATNTVGKDQKTFRGIVDFRPKIVVDKTQYTAVEGDKILRIPCSATGFPAPSITWEVDRKRIASGPKYSTVGGILLVLKPDEHDTRDYTCIATNKLGEDRLTFKGVVELRPKILLDRTQYTAVEGDKVLRIPCRALGSPAPTITWEVDGKRVELGAKYSLEEGALVVHSPRVSDTRDYTCVAASRLGADRLTVKGVVELRPKIVVDKTKYTAVEGDKALRIPCRATGSPAPSITWEVNRKRVEPGAKYSLEEGALVVHSPRVSDTRDYTCIAASRLGADRLIIRGVVELHPKIILEANKTKYTALEGDEVLKIPCRAIGAPTPSITWEVDGKRVESGSKYSIISYTLFVLKPDERDTRDYTCIATNKLGEDRLTFKGVVEREITSFDKINKLFLKDGSTYKLECGLPHSESDTLRWFEHVEGLNDTGTTVLTLLDTTISQSGNYSCRVSNKDGYSMITYDVNFGRAPVFSADADEVVEWWGVGILNCLVKAEPSAKVQWYREGKLMETPDDEMQKVIPGWGHYSCNVSNIHGSVERRFVVVSTDCLIHKREEELGHQPPIIASESGTLLSGNVKNDYHIIPRQKKLILSCRNQSSESNSFKSLPGLDEVQATCVGEDKFLVNGKEYKYSDLQCTRTIEPLVIRTGEKCIDDKTEIVKVGYQLKEFTEVYRVCMDLTVNRPLYSRLINVRNEESSLTMPWQTVSGFDAPRRSYGNLQCENSTSKCCLSYEQLVKANDVPFGAAQRSTFIDNVNTVLYWRGCNDSRNGWDELKHKLSIYTVLSMWSGASDYNDQGVAILPKYLWKVVSTLEAGYMAVVYVNEKEPDDSQVLCKNVCPPGDDESFIESSDKYMYCCELSDFSKAFHIPESVFTM